MVYMYLWSDKMSSKQHIKSGIVQGVWLMMAVFCIVFSSAFKRLVQLRADEKAGVVNKVALSRSLTQSLKDGHREKHEYQIGIAREAGQSPVPGRHPSMAQLHAQVSNGYSGIINSFYARLVFNEPRPVYPSALPLYLRFRNLTI